MPDTHYPGIIGWACKLYVTPVSTPILVPIVGDVTAPMKHSEVEATTREGGGFKQWVAGLTEVGATFFLQKRKGHAAYTAIRDSFRNKTALEWNIADGLIATAGTELITAKMQVFDFSEEQKLDGVVGHTVTIKPTWCAADDIPEITTVV